MQKQDKPYKTDGARIVELTHSLVKGNPSWKRRWEKVADKLQRAMEMLQNEERAIRYVKTWMKRVT